MNNQKRSRTPDMWTTRDPLRGLRPRATCDNLDESVIGVIGEGEIGVPKIVQIQTASTNDVGMLSHGWTPESR